MADGSEDPANIGPFVVHRKLGEGAMGVVYAGYDVDLDRKVALKLVRRQLLDRPSVRDRMVREAKAMARLSSPHVVQVYQVGPHKDGIYVAMEYIDGASLGEWLKAEKRPWSAVLRTVCGAGRGLAAAHAAGLVHRDFKPDNVLVDASGHARVLDFGLVQSEHVVSTTGETVDLMQSAAGLDETMHSTDVGGGVERSNIHWSVRLTQFGRAVGTPAYMSPEQHFGEPVGPYSDQFSFAITLYEALYGVRPFSADSWDSLKAQVRRGDISPPPADSRVPGWVFKAIARGLAIEPGQRWPSMAAMVAALERDPRRTRVRLAGVLGLLGAVSAGSYTAAAARTAEEDRCGGGAEALAGAWDEARRQAVAQAFTATRASFAPDVLRRVESRLDGYAAAWAAEHRSACEANVAGHQTSGLLDLRMACLGRRKAHVAALVDVLATADQSVVENAVQAVASLPSVQACADAQALLAVAPPSDPQTALKVDQLRLQLAQAEAHEDTGRYAQGLVLAQKVRGEAATLGYGPLEAEAALGEGSLLMTVGRNAEAEAALVRAVQAAIVHDQHAVAAEAAAKRIFVMATGLGQAAGALVTRPVAEALVQRAQGEARLAALLHNNLGVAYAISREYDLSATQFERTIALLSSAGGPPDPLIAVTQYNLGNLYIEQGRPEKARAPLLTAVELFTKFVGDRHPQVAWPLDGLGDVALMAGSYAEAERYYGDALALMEAALGPVNPYMVDPLLGLSRVYARTRRDGEAIAMYRRAISVGERSRANEPIFAEILEELGELVAANGEHAEARRLFERSVEVTAAALGKDTEKQAQAALHAGEMAEKLGDRAAALGWYERVLAVAPGTKAEVRAVAAVGLARGLADKPEATGRVCDLLVEARLSLKSTDALLDEVNALQTRRCAAPAE